MLYTLGVVLGAGLCVGIVTWVAIGALGRWIDGGQR